MYDYRRMTPEERQAIVQLRKKRGFPWHKPPHPAQGEGWYFITGATYEHRPHFSAPVELTALERRLLEAFAESHLSCGGWIVFPNHYHALVHAPDLAVVGKALGSVHGRSARYANKRDGAPGRQVWYKYSDRKVRSERHYWACLHYIIANPVKHEYVAGVADWQWSCYHELVEHNGAAWIEDLMHEYPLGDFGVSWDI